jgi:hypothetical protein
MNFMKYFIFTGFFLFMLTSCKNEKLNIPDGGRKIVINGLVTADSLLNVRINKSIFYNDYFSEHDSGPAKANVRFYLNDQCLDTLHNINNFSNLRLNDFWYESLHFFYESNYWSEKVKALPGREYKLLVKAPGMPDASASTFIPDRVRIEEMDTSRLIMPPDLYHPDHNWVRLICNLRFTDPGFESNYYMVSVSRKPGNGQFLSNIWFDSHDIIVEEKLSNENGIYAIAFSDKAINGTKYSFQVLLDTDLFGMPFWDDRSRYDGIPYPTENKKTIYIKLYSITNEYFRFLHSMNQYKKNYENPLSEPVMIYSNIEGGLGILGGAAVSCDSLVFVY